ncbi:MAG: redoxin domain-containing protein [Thermoproteota archaeon]
MRTEIKTAIIMGVVIIGGIAGVSMYFSSIEEQIDKNNANTQSTQNGSDLLNIDKSRFKKAPTLEGIAGYINTDPEDLRRQLEGNVVLYDIWTYSCINCQRTLPYITAWHDKYADNGLVIIGIHSPEFEFEKDINNVKLAVEKFGITYPVVLDNDKKIWDAFENRYWPRKYIADDQGYIRYDHIGEGAYDETEMVIQELLKERAERLGLNVAVAQPLVDIDEFKHGSRTPELYFGYDFAFGRNQLGNKEGFQPGKSVEYVIPQSLKDNYFYLGGTWENLEDRMILNSESGSIVLPYFAKQVNIVAAGNSELEILLDGKPISRENAGVDVTYDGKVVISESTLYNLVNTAEAAKHTIQINVNKPGFEIYTFTFG